MESMKWNLSFDYYMLIIGPSDKRFQKTNTNKRISKNRRNYGHLISKMPQKLT